MRNIVEKPDKEHNPRGKNLILRFLNARVSLPSWMLALSSMALSFIAAYLMLFGPGLQEFGDGLPFAGYLWTPLLVIGTTATVVGLIFIKRVMLLRYGAFLSFLMWILGGISFATTGQVITTVIVALPWIIFYAYVYLASFFRDQTGL